MQQTESFSLKWINIPFIFQTDIVKVPVCSSVDNNLYSAAALGYHAVGTVHNSEKDLILIPIDIVHNTQFPILVTLL